jgi:16S rRNA (cytidine1402-2'-O)-methyltransferase
MDNQISTGTLYVVATPIGNLEDMTFRAVKVLKQVDLIAAEDTRHSRRLLSHYGIKTGLISCHEHNESQRAPELINRLKEGLSIALISDAGTPTISDPGYKLVTAVSKEKIPVVPIPGCSAAIAGLSVAGLPTDAFLFMGFLPKKQQRLRQSIEALMDQQATLIFYESPRRLQALVEQMLNVLGDRQACLTREITKLHEEIIHGPLSEILTALEGRDSVKGECVLFVQGQTRQQTIDAHALEKIILARLSRNDLGTSGLASQISKEFNLSKKQVYDTILRLR